MNTGVGGQFGGNGYQSQNQSYMQNLTPISTGKMMMMQGGGPGYQYNSMAATPLSNRMELMLNGVDTRRFTTPIAGEYEQEITEEVKRNKEACETVNWKKQGGNNINNNNP